VDSLMMGVSENISHSTAKTCQSIIMHSSSYNSQVKCFQTQVNMDIFPCIGMGNLCPQFFWTFQLHPIYMIQIQVRIVFMHNLKIEIAI
jgi:hypothetical protein